jgi:oxygen-independent coproporphyrinogen-3 oxidase
MSLLQAQGMSRAAYHQRFGDDVLEHFPELHLLGEAELASVERDFVRLTPAGLERSDAIGPWFYSARVRQRSEEYAWS